MSKSGLESIDFALFLPGATWFSGQSKGNRNDTYKGNLLVGDLIVPAFVKIIPPRDIFVECVCAISGRFLGLPIPKPYITKITKEDYPGIEQHELYRDDTGFILGFGAEDAVYPSFREPLKSDSGMEKYIPVLLGFPKTKEVAIFDEWIGNPDRNAGNVLFDGDSDFFFIDHELSIQEGLPPNQMALENQLADLLKNGLTEFERHQISKLLSGTLIEDYEKFPFQLISDKTKASSYLDDTTILIIIDFIEKRVAYLIELFKHRIGDNQKRIAL